MLSFNQVNAATGTSALHTSGNQIIDANNNVVTLRGVGVAGMAPDLILWGQGGSDNWGDQWVSASSSAVTDTFQEMSQTWHINMIRVFVYPEWYWQNSAPGSNGNTQSYIQTLASEAAQYGIYVDLVPYQLTACTNSFSGDQYGTPDQGGAQGLPMSGFDTQGQSFLSSTGLSEQAFWTQYWTLMANNLKGYSNVIFEAWNEPAATGNWGEPVASGYLTYLQTMYNAIRATGATNLIFQQWEMGWTPGDNLGWVSTVNNALGGNPSNVVYTTHLYYHAPTDLSSYWGSLTASNIQSELQTAISQMGITAPLVSNEEGSCLGVASNVQNDYTWWNLLVQAQAKLGIGFGAYYWLSDSGLGSAYVGETLISSGYTPNTMGQDYINTYSASSSSPTPTPTSSPTATSRPTSTPTATPSPTATPAPGTSLGLTTIGSTVNQMSGDVDGTRYQLTQAGTLQSINVYFGNSGFSGKAAVYSDNSGKVGSLLAQSSAVSVSAAGWTTFAMTSPISLATGYYWLCVQTNSASSTSAYSSGSTNQHVWLTISYNSEWTSSFGTASGYEAMANSIYATMAAGATSTPSPTPAPTATPTPTSAPTPSPTPSPTATSKPTASPTPAPTATPKPSASPTPSPTPAPSGTNIVTNGGFENGVSPWQVVTSGSTYSGTITQSTDSHSGSYSGLFTVTSYGKNGYVALSEPLSAQVGQSYTLTFWYKSTEGFAMPHVFCKGSSGNDITFFSGPQLSATNTWTLETMTFGPIPSGTVLTELHFDVGGKGTVQIDDLSAVNSSPSPTPTPTTTSTQSALIATPTSSPTVKPAARLFSLMPLLAHISNLALRQLFRFV